MADPRLRRARNVPDDWVEMRHPAVERTMRCHPRAVKHWKERGWVEVNPARDAAAVNHKPSVDRAVGKEG